jgi:hypothetical protein
MRGRATRGDCLISDRSPRICVAPASRAPGSRRFSGGLPAMKPISTPALLGIALSQAVSRSVPSSPGVRDDRRPRRRSAAVRSRTRIQDALCRARSTGLYRRRHTAFGCTAQRRQRCRLTTGSDVPSSVTSTVWSAPPLEHCSQVPTVFMLIHRHLSGRPQVLVPYDRPALGDSVSWGWPMATATANWHSEAVGPPPLRLIGVTRTEALCSLFRTALMIDSSSAAPPDRGGAGYAIFAYFRRPVPRISPALQVGWRR